MKVVFKVCLAGLGLLGAGLVACLAVSYWFSGVSVEIVNLGPQPLQAVSVDVAGASYSLGDLASGSHETVKVRPSRPSSLEISHGARFGKAPVLYVDTYLEPGFSGKITVQIKAGKIVHVQQKVTIPSFI